MPEKTVKEIESKIVFESGVGHVTGANFLFKLKINNSSGAKELNILIDCGLMQGDKDSALENRKPFAYNPKEIDYLFVTHAHLDHVGRIPKLIKDGFVGKIISTPSTMELAQLILEDAVSLLDREARHEGLLPIYEMKDVSSAFSLWKSEDYHQPFGLDGVDNSLLSIEFKDAGHVLGSSMVCFTLKNNEGNQDKKNIVFTGDLGNSPAPLLKDTEFLENADYIIMESVYGDRNHEPKDKRRLKLINVVKETIAKGGTLIIPAFSLERTQVMLYELNELVESGYIPSVPVYIDSPLAIKITEIYKRSTQYFNDKIQDEIKNGDDIFSFPKLHFTITSDDSRMIEKSPVSKIIIAGSGMSMGGRVTHHEAHYLPDPKNTILLVGYQTAGSTGRMLIDGEKKVKIDGSFIKVKSKIEKIDGYSAHKDSDHLIEFIEKANTAHKLKKVFVVMGEPKSSLFLVQRLRDYIDVDAIYPERGIEYLLD